MSQFHYQYQSAEEDEMYCVITFTKTTEPHNIQLVILKHILPPACSNLYWLLREAVKNFLADFFGTPLTENHFAKNPLAEMGGTPPSPLTESLLSFSGNCFP